MNKQGLIHLYTGHGKGKTTAALGLAFRAAGAGLRVIIYQFLKPADLDLSERRAIEKSGLDITVAAQGVSWNMIKSFDDPQTVKQSRQEICELLKAAQIQAAKKEYDVIIFDELAYCHSKGLADLDDIKEIINLRNPEVEIIITGRDAKPELIEIADYATQMQPLKHPYEKGIIARKGIEF